MQALKRAYERIIEKLYLNTDKGKLHTLNSINLSKPLFYKPTADGSTLLKWHSMLTGLKSIDGYGGFDASEVKSALASTVVTEETHIEKFDFSKIQSLSCSKSFGQSFINTVNGSWFDDICSWGASMYFNDKMSAATSKDWEDNIAHVEKDAFHRERTMKVHYLSWIDRYYAPQSGGSHHSALVAYQIKYQNRRYEREATVLKHSIDTAPLDKLSESNYAFVTGAKLSTDKNSPIKYAIHQRISEEFFELAIEGSATPTSLVIIPKSQLLIPEHVFEEWLNCNIAKGTIIPFRDLLANHNNYCREPYIHGIDTITLGDPTLRASYNNSIE